MQPQSCFVTCHSRQNISCCLLEDALQRTALHVGVWCMVPGRCWRFLATCREKRRFRRHLCLTRGYGTASAGREVTIRLCLCHTFSTERVRVLSHSHTSHTYLCGPAYAPMAVAGLQLVRALPTHALFPFFRTSAASRRPKQVSQQRTTEFVHLWLDWTLRT